MHTSTYVTMQYFVNQYLADKVNENIVVFDLGSQDVNGSYREIFNNENWRYIGCDMVPGKNVDLVINNVYDWQEVPSESMDVAIAGQVFEHVEYFWNTMMELVRVLKDDCYGCIIAPAVCPEHKYPLDCWRFYADGFSAIAKFAGVQIIESRTEWTKPDPGGANLIDSVLIFKKVKLPEYEKIKRDTKIEIVKVLARDYEINI